MIPRLIPRNKNKINWKKENENEKKNVDYLKHTFGRVPTDITMEDASQNQYKYNGHDLLL